MKSKRLKPKFNNSILKTIQDRPEYADYFTVKQASDKLQISKNTLYGWLDARLIPYKVIGLNRKLVKMQDVESVLFSERGAV